MKYINLYMIKDLQGWEYIGPGGFQQMRGYPIAVDSDENSKDEQIADSLWQVSEEMTGVFYLSKSK